MSIQTQRLIIMILIIITFGTMMISSMFAFQETGTIKSRLIFGINFLSFVIIEFYMMAHDELQVSL